MPLHPYTKTYDLDYFDASQMFLYIGDVWVDEVTSLSYSVQQNKTPIYGYASQLFDDTAAGQIIVTGNFTINFKEQGYLWAVLRRYKNITEIGAGIFPENKRDARKQSRRDAKLHAKKGSSVSGRPLVGSNGTRVSRATIERLVQGEATKNERYNFYNQLAGYATIDTKSPRDKIFEDIVEIFEDQVWRKDITDEGLNSQIRRTDDNRFDDFDMYVVFGNYAVPGVNHSVQKIIGVRLTSQGKQIMVDGGPIQEQYSFIARTVA